MTLDAATKAYLDRASEVFQLRRYIRFDPISVPHGFDDPRDQEIIGLFAALLAWGRRDIMLRKLEELCERMSYQPSRFVRDFKIDRAAHHLEGFKHRTFQPSDAIHLTANLSACLRRHGSIENIVTSGGGAAPDIGPAIQRLSESLLGANADTPARLTKHLARPSTGSACKRLCMYFRWMVRPGPFDLHVWKRLDPATLILPLDVHSGRQARRFGLLESATDNWRAATELTENCRLLCPDDPAKYDFALFGLGAYDPPDELADREPSTTPTVVPTAR